MFLLVLRPFFKILNVLSFIIVFFRLFFLLFYVPFNFCHSRGRRGCRLKAFCTAQLASGKSHPLPASSPVYLCFVMHESQSSIGLNGRVSTILKRLPGMESEDPDRLGITTYIVHGTKCSLTLGDQQHAVKNIKAR
jgi:RNase P/RNase MRP subunit p29